MPGRRSGVSGNPGGHPVGARGRFSEQHYARSKFHVTKVSSFEAAFAPFHSGTQPLC